MKLFSIDILIIGGGIMGLTLALEAKRRYPDQTITILEKEATCGEHASGRNSGVLHAGFYYSADSLKAKLTRDGNRRMRDYCEEMSLSINPCGKLVVARDEWDLFGLDELLKRAQANGVELESISLAEMAEIEPRARSFSRALFSPTTASVNPNEVMASLVKDAVVAGITIQYNSAYLSHQGNTVVTSQGEIEAGYVINAAGLYADKVALDYGFSQRYRILPFKGLYLYSNEPAGALRTNIYPVPDLDRPFLGVHFTVSVDGINKIGPTAIPAFWREQYQGMTGFNGEEALEIARREMSLLISNDFGFRDLAREEMRKYNRKNLVRLASELVEGIELKNYQKWGRPGIRAQLMDIENNSLVMDYLLEGDENSFHLLNAVSPAFTCSFAFADYCWDEIEKKNS